MTRRRDETFLALAARWAARSPHQDNKVGAVLVGRTGAVIGGGCNAPVRGVVLRASRQRRGQRSNWYTCAERNALAVAAAGGRATRGARLYCTQLPCSHCADFIIAAGIRLVVVPATANPRQLQRKWQVLIARALVKFAEAGLPLRRC